MPQRAERAAGKADGINGKRAGAVCQFVFVAARAVRDLDESARVRTGRGSASRTGRNTQTEDRGEGISSRREGHSCSERRCGRQGNEEHACGVEEQGLAGEAEDHERIVDWLASRRRTGVSVYYPGNFNGDRKTPAFRHSTRAGRFPDAPACSRPPRSARGIYC